LSKEFRENLSMELSSVNVRFLQVLNHLGVSKSSWYYTGKLPEERRSPGPEPYLIPDYLFSLIVKKAEENPWYGYRKIAIICRWENSSITDRQVYRVMKENNLLHKRKDRTIELQQARKLFELLPRKANQLWQMDVTYVHIAGYGWWYAVTVIDYYSRYLLAAKLVSSYCAHEVIKALEEAREEAERLHGPLGEDPFIVTDNGSSFIAKRFIKFVSDGYKHVRIQYRTPTQLGLLERFHKTFKDEEVYWRLYDNPDHARECFEEFKERYNYKRPHWALIPKNGGDVLTPKDVYIYNMPIRIPEWQQWAKNARKKIENAMAVAA
jgi:transposase InsO family protein